MAKDTSYASNKRQSYIKESSKGPLQNISKIISLEYQEEKGIKYDAKYNRLPILEEPIIR
jgi:hypothetical protein